MDLSLPLLAAQMSLYLLLGSGLVGSAMAASLDRYAVRPRGVPATPSASRSAGHKVRPALVVALTGALWVGLELQFGPSATLPAELVLVTGLVPLAASDLESYLLPKRLLYPTLAATAAAIVVAGSVDGEWSRLLAAAICGLGAWVGFLLLHLMRPSWLGFGDVRLAGLLGLGLGWATPSGLLFALLVSNLAAAGVGLGLIATRRATRETPLPYGVFLALGTVAALLVPRGLLHLTG